MIRKATLSLITVLVILLSSCSPQSEHLTFIVTTDVHGAFFPTDPISGRQMKGSMAHLSSYLKTLENKENIILLDNGDIIQGDPSAYYYNFENTSISHLFPRILHKLDYDAATIGNHDIEAGHQVYDRINKELEIPWLAANCINTSTNKPYFEPYTIITKGKIRVAVLGMITPRIPDWLPENIWSGMEFQDMIDAAKYWIPIINETEKPDLIVGLFHAGLEYTYNNQTADMKRNENAVRLVAQQVPGFDIIFAGHDHKTWNEYQIDTNGDSVLLLGSQSKAREIARADIVFKKSGKHWQVEKMEAQNIYMGNQEPDPEFVSYFEKDFAEIKQYVNQEVAELTTPLESKKAFFGPSEFMTLIHEVQLGVSGAKISFAAPLAYNSIIPAGMLHVDALFDLYRFENLLYTMELSGQEILDYLNFSYGNWINSMSDKTDHLIRMKTDKDGRYRTITAYYNFDSALGIDYTVDLRKAQGQQVSILKLSNGEKFDLNKKYHVAINSYRGNGGGGHLTQGAGIDKEKLASRIISATDKDLRFYMKSWMEDKKTIEVTQVENWKIIPEDFYQSGKAKDYKILFKN